ncbi:MAG: efflux RND transporter permease subunit [Rhodospirillales bacterium]|nr:efflux RND transporter permease subunit [Rhodospirillales bacterium]
MSFAALIERHRRAILVVMAALTLAGLYAATLLPVGLFPQVSFPRVRVELAAGDRPARQMVLLVTRRVEEAVRSVPGLRAVRSVTSRGSAQVQLDFGWGRDMIQTTLEVQQAINDAMPDLPPGTTASVLRMDPTTFPIISYGLTSSTVPPSRLREIVQYQLAPLLAAIPGVKRVGVEGGAVPEVQARVDPARLAAHGLALSDVVAALRRGGVLASVGRAQDHDKLFLVLVNDSFRRLAQIRDTVLASGPGGVLMLGDVAQVMRGDVPQWVRVTEDGKPAVLFNVYEQPSGNAVRIAAAVRATIARFPMPPGITVRSWYDQSVLVTQSAASVRDAVLVGLGLAGLVLLVFLRSWRVTLVAMLAVPATLAITVLVLFLLGQSFNIMTLGGIAAAVGLVIDDVIVMIEHIARRAERGGARGVLAAAREFLVPLGGSSLATIIVFVPLAFLGGVTGAFSRALALTMGSALAISMLLTLGAVPLLARGLIDFRRWRDPGASGPGAIGRAHQRLLGRLIAWPWLIAAVLAPLAALGYVAYARVPTGFMPAMDEGGFVMDYHTLPGTSLTETDRELRQIEAILRADPAVATFSRRTGMGLGGDLNEPNQGDVFVRLIAGARAPIGAVMARIRARVHALVPGVTVDTAQLMSDLIGDLTAVPQPIEIKLFDPDDTAALIPTARRVAAAIARLRGVVEVRSGVVLAGDALDIRVNPIAAATQGVTPEAVRAALATALTGTVAAEIPTAHRMEGVRVWTPASLRRTLPDIAALPIRAPDGHLFPLSMVARLRQVSGQPEIDRDNLQQMVAVTGRIEGRGLGAAIADVRGVLARPGLIPPGMRVELGGLYRQQQIAFAGLIRVFLAALVAEFVLLLILYQRFWLPAIIIASALFSTTAVFTGLWVSGVALNITALMGMTMIIGISTELAIFYVSEYVELARHMPARQALAAAAGNRLRPIAMTTLAAILTLLPLALAIGAGSGMQQPLAIAIISGLLLQFPLVLLAVPVAIGLTLPRRARMGTGPELP